MLIHCHGKKCNTTRDHKLKLETNDAICMDCGEQNVMVSDFMKNAMKASGDLYRTAQSRKAFMYRCGKCSVDRGVKIIDEQPVCEVCQHPFNLSAPMLEAIKSTAGAATKGSSSLDGAEDPKEELAKGVIKRRKG